MSLMSPRDPRAVLGRGVVRLQARVTALAERLEAGDEGAWAPYCVAIEALAVLAPAPRLELAWSNSTPCRPWRGWFSMPGCRCGLCAATWTGDGSEALPCYRIGGKMVVKRSKCDGGLQQFRSLRQPR